MRLNYHNFSVMQQELQFQRADFVHDKFGSQEQLVYNGKKYTTTKLIGHLPGIHIISSFARHLNTLRRDKEYQLFPEDPQAIFINRKLKSGTYNFIDIRRCYWHTAYNMGLMPYRLYKQGCDNEEYKDACNAAVGRLGMNRSSDVYKNGVLSGVPIVHVDHFQQYVRYHILAQVNSIMRHILDQSKKDYAFILTDGMYLGDKADILAKEVMELHGYDFHCGLAQVNGVSADKVFFNETYFNYSDKQVY